MEERLKQSLVNIQKLTHKLALTPGLKQRLHILQMPVLELRQCILQQLEENPLLEIPQDEAEQIPAEEKTEVSGVDENFDEYLSAGDTRQGMQKQDQEKDSYKKSLITKKITLSEHLLHQLHMIKLSGKERTIGEYLIENLDKNGYLETDLEEIAQIKKADLRETQKLLKLIQGFEPYGVGARSLSECLLIQLNSIKDKQNSIAKAIVKKYLGELKKKKYSLIAKNLKISVDEVKEAVKDILCLEPKPGRSFGNVRDAQTVSPDVFLIPAKDGYQIKLNDDELPELRISSKYKQLLSDKKTSQETKKFLKERLEAALWLIKSVAKRHDTIRRIAETIVEIQKKALDEGHEHLKPLKLKDVADRCNLHISTVSRAVSEKYIETPNGYFRLKDFFSGEFKSEMDSSYSSENLKSEIKKLIDSEDKNNPLTDKDIAETLNKKEMKINRRTIVKYRDQLKIPPSYLRKTLFNGE